VNALHIEVVFRNVPEKLSLNVDGSVKRYRFTGVLPKAKSLASYKQRYAPVQTVKLIGSAGGTQETGDLVLPLYYAAQLRHFISD